MPVSSRCVRLIILVFFVLSAGTPTFGQITNVTNDQSVPIPGAGHNYIQMLNETVNPANGSVSLRLNVPLPKGRGLSIPFSFAYDSNGVRHLEGDTNGGALWISDTSFLSQGGWSYSAPLLSWNTLSVPWFNGGGGCSYTTDFVLQDPAGGRHALGLSTTTDNQGGDGSAACGLSSTASAGDDLFRAATNLPNNAVAPPVWASSLDGTVFYFSSRNPHNWAYQANVVFPDYVEDRNGNKMVINDLMSGTTNRGAFNYSDTLGRTLLSSSGFGTTGNTVSISGLPGTYSISWGTASASYSISSVYLNPPGNCAAPPNASGSQPAITGVTLPTGQSYQISYDPTYGLVSKITYPSGGYVRYVWGINSLSDIAEYPSACPPGQTCNPPGICDYRYDTPVVMHRYVSFDGTHEVLQQDFTYSTNWSSSSSVYWATKQTNVTTKDLVRGTSFQTAYTYASAGCGGPDAPNVYTHFGIQCPVEQTILYKNTDGSTLRTVSKTWQDVNMLLSEQTALENGQTSKTAYFYANNNATPLLIEKDEYDFGATSPTRKTITAYQSFANTPIYTFGPSIADRPCKVDVYSVGTSPIAETQYFYDGGTALCGAGGTPSVVAVSNLPGGTHDEANYGSASTAPRGNLTKLIKLCKPSCTPSYPATAYAYDETGQLISMTDACGNATCSDMTGTSHTTTYSYADNYDSPPSASTNAYVTKITNALGQITRFKYAYSDGQLLQSVDENSQPTNYVYNDSLRRLTETDYPDGGKTTVSYNDAPPSPSVTTSRLVNTSPLYVTTVSTMDGLGHTVQTALTTDPDGATYTYMTYDGSGRPYQAFNPTRCSPPTTNCGEATWGYITNTFDALGRTTQITKQDGQIVTSSYNGNCTTTTDEAGKARKSCSDALGRLTQVFEDPANLNYETDYAYDGLDNLIDVYQKGGTTSSSNWHTRTFNYDSLSRLQSATNPESGTASYTYDANGNLASKTSPAPNQTGTATITLTYCYDAINRLTAEAYTTQSCPMSSPVATYLYDQSSYNGLTITNGIGRRTGMTDRAGSEAWSYDAMGRIATDRRTTNGVTKSFPYTYNLDGSVASDYTITYTQGSGGRYTSAGNSGYALAYNVHYAPNGSMCYMNAAWGNTFTHIWTFNNRFQPVAIQLYGTGHGSSPSPCTASTDTTGEPVDLVYSFIDANGHNNGNVVSITNISGGNDGDGAQNFIYDSLNRIASAQTSAINQPGWSGDTGYLQECWAEQYSYDPWGNLVSIAPSSSSQYTGCSQESGFNFTGAIGANNRITASGYGYDSAGNLIAAPPTGTTYSYDAENHLTSAGGMTYVYDGDGKRVEKASGSPLVANKIYWYGSNTAPLIETDGAGNFQYAYFYFNGILVGRQESSNWMDHYGLDALGNVRWVYGYNGAWDISDYYPFGGERVVQPNSNNSRKFTSKERDYESGNDNFGARYYGSSPGRFMSPDPDGAGSLGQDPQSWNAYAYVRNNPLNLTDPSGTNYLVCQTVDTGGGAGGAASASHCVDLTDKQYDQFRTDNPNLHSSPSGELSYTNADGSETKIGTQAHYDEHAFDSLIQAGRTAQIGLNYALALTAPNYLAVGAAHALLAGSSLTVLSGQACAIACPAIPILGNKLDFLFGLAENVGPSGAYNVQRSASMLQDMESVGLSDSPEVREYVTQKLTEALNNPAAVEAIQGNGRKVIDVFLMGPNGGIKLQTIWQGSRLISVITKR